MFQKLREAALAYHLTRKWSKEQILRNYLNTIYFGNGAYGIESAARTYFQPNHPGCDEPGQPPCASQLAPHEAALLAGMVASPSALRPDRRTPTPRTRAATSCCSACSSRATSRSRSTRTRRPRTLPTRGDLQPPEEDTEYPYFTSWIKQQVVDQLGGGQEGARQAFEGGLRVQTTIDGELQDAAEQAINAWLPNRDGPRAVARRDRQQAPARSGRWSAATTTTTLPFNLATQGQRQPGSAFKPFVLAEALRAGHLARTRRGPRRSSTFDVPRSKEVFTVNNYEDAYSGMHHPRARDDLLRQLGVRAGRHQDRHAQDRAAGRAHGHPHARSRPTAR